MKWRLALLLLTLLVLPILFLPSNGTIVIIGGGGGGYQFIGIESASLTIGSNTEYYAIGLTYNGTNATPWLELYNFTKYSIKNWTVIYDLGLAGIWHTNIRQFVRWLTR